MEISDWWVGQLPMRVVWRFAGMGGGELCVMTPGLLLMQLLPADSWDTQQLVSISAVCMMTIQWSYGNNNLHL